jgi:hypothetical protein
MNRRSFLTKSALALFGFTVLPPANTYERIWTARLAPKINPEWIKAEYEMAFHFDAAYKPSQFRVIDIPTQALLSSIQYANIDGIWQKVFDDSPIQA